MLLTRSSVTMDSRTGAVVEVWLSLPAGDAEALPLPDETALRALQPRPGWKASAIGPYPPTVPTAAPSAVKTAKRSSRPRPPYTYGSYTGTAGDRWYYSLSLRKM